MAAIDFPNSPTIGQIFQPGNGFTYQWDGTLWKQISGLGMVPTGDFSAVYTGGNYGPPTTPAVFAFGSVRSGNAGGYYNPATGRYTPPAGRYAVSAVMHWTFASGTPTPQIFLYKNGVNIGPNSYGYGSSSTYWMPTVINATVDMNGTDYLEIWVACATTAGGAQIVGGLASFSAFPIIGSSVLTGGGNNAIFTGDTPPPNPQVNWLWYNSTLGALYLYYNDGNSVQWVPANPPQNLWTAPGADPGCKTTFLGADTAYAASFVSLINTGQIGAANQKWRISAVINVTTPQAWSYCQIVDQASNVLAYQHLYVSVNTAATTGVMEFIIVLSGPTTFTLQVMGSASSTAYGGRKTSITAERLV